MEAIIIAFKADPSQKETEFPTTFNSKERSKIHEFCKKNGLFSKSEEKNGTITFKVFKERQAVAEVKITNKHIKELIRYYNLSIPIYDVRYFDYFKDLHCVQKEYDLLVQAVQTLAERYEDFKDHGVRVAAHIVKELASTEAYKEFISDKFNLPTFPPTERLNKTELYVDPSKVTWPQFYFSFDIIKANYNCLKWYDPKLVSDTETWEELAKKFTDIEFFIHSKYFRQVVFGNLNNKRTATLQTYLQMFLYLRIKDLLKVQGRMGTDEIIACTSLEQYESDLSKINQVISGLPENMKNIWRVTYFKIEPLGKNSECYVKTDLITEKIEFKNISKDLYAQAIKFYYKRELHPLDLKIMKENFNVTLDDPHTF